MGITEVIERLERLDLEAALSEAIAFTKEEYADMNREQWKEGITSTGADIMPSPYSLGYAKIRLREGLPIDVIDLRRKGAFYGGYTIDQDGSVMHLSSDVDYEKWITHRYGEKIYGLTDESMAKYRGVINAVLLAAIKEQFYS